MDNDKGLFFLTLSLICVWLIVDNYIGKKYVSIFLTNMFGLKGLTGDGDGDADGDADGDGDYSFYDDMTDEKGIIDVPTIFDIFGNGDTSDKTSDSSSENFNPLQSDKIISKTNIKTGEVTQYKDNELDIFVEQGQEYIKENVPIFKVYAWGGLKIAEWAIRFDNWLNN